MICGLAGLGDDMAPRPVLQLCRAQSSAPTSAPLASIQARRPADSFLAISMFITGFAAVALAAGESAPPGAKVLSKPIHLREIVSEVERMMAAA